MLYQKHRNLMPLEIKKANRYLFHIILIGLGIGSANYIIHDNFSWLQASILSITTSFIIGYPLVVIALNRAWVEYNIRLEWKLYLVLLFCFFLFGSIATEVEQLIKQFVFSNSNYQPFSGGKMYLFNGIISIMLGLSFFKNTSLVSNPSNNSESNRVNDVDFKQEQNEDSPLLSPIDKIPVKQGDATSLVLTKDVVYFEAFDNYSFLYDINGEKKLCDYSLLFLQKRLDNNFCRVHRKYIINTSHVNEIRPHSNARYLIQFKAAKLSSITSSKSYSTTIRSIIKLD